MVVVLTTAKSETGLSRDSLARAIEYLETQPQTLVRDTTLMYYYNDLCEKSIFGNDPLADERLERFNRAWKKSSWPIGEALYLRAVGKKYDKLGQYEKAVESYHGALKIMEEHKSAPEHVVYTKILLGFVMLNNGNEEECLRLFKEAEPFALQLENTSHAIWIIDFYGDNTLFHAKGKEDYEKALAYYKRVEELLPNSLIKNQIPNNLQGQAAVYELLNNKEKAEEYRARALLEAKLIPNYFVLFNIYTDYADAEIENGNYPKAIEYRKLAIAAADSQQYLEFVNRAHYELYHTYKQSGDIRNALATLEYYQILEDSLKRREVNEKYAELNKKYEFEKQQLAISDLQNKNLKYGLMALVVTILGGILLLFFQARTKKKIAELNDQLSQRNREVEEALYEGKQLERRRVSDKLHDSIATKLSALKWRVEASEGKMENSIYTPLVAELEKLYEDVRSMAHELRPLEFLDKGLKAATEQLFASIAGQSNAVFEIEIDEKVGKINKSLQYHVYQFVMELCTNMQKHSRPSKVSFLMQIIDDHISIRFKNDGLLNEKPLKEGQGLRNIRTKVSHYGGNVRIEKDENFDLEINIPLV
jgi:signal transduction histidine kinase